MPVARVGFAFLLLEIYIVLKVGISSKNQAAVSVIANKTTAGEGVVKASVCSTVPRTETVNLN